MAFLSLTSLISVLLVQPLVIYQFGFLSNIPELEFLPYEDVLLSSIIPVKDTLMFAVLTVLLYMVYGRWKIYQEEKQELEQLFKNCLEMQVSSKCDEYGGDSENDFDTKIAEQDVAISELMLDA